MCAADNAQLLSSTDVGRPKWHSGIFTCYLRKASFTVRLNCLTYACISSQGMQKLCLGLVMLCKSYSESLIAVESQLKFHRQFLVFGKNRCCSFSFSC